MRQWLLGIVLTAFAGGLARQLAPQGKEQAGVRLVSGLLLALAILRPLAGLDWAGLDWDLDRLEAQEQAEAYREEGRRTLSAVIAERTEAYIWDKGNQLGLDCVVRVTTTAGEIPLPETVTILGRYSEALAVCVEEEVGIPAEKQIFLEERQWTERKENESG